MGILFINLLALAQSLSGAVMSHKNISSRELLSWPDDSVVALSKADSKAGKDNRINTTLALWILLVPFVLGGLSLLLHPGPRFVCTSERGTFVFKAAISCDPLLAYSWNIDHDTFFGNGI